jgi:hypothetical protein
MEVIPSTIRGRLIKKYSSQHPLSIILKETALSKKEVIATWILYKLDIFSNIPLYENGCNYGYIGNIGIKSHISPELKLYVSSSNDIDVAVPSVNYFKNSYKKKERLVDRVIARKEVLSYTYEIVYSPFEVYRLLIPPIQIGYREYREIDVFDVETGIGPISLSKEDFKKCKNIEYLHSSSIEMQIATHLNPLAYTHERGKRAFLATISTPDIDYDVIQQKIEESVDRIRKVGISLFQYKEGFGRISRKCIEVERKFIKRKNITKRYHIENWITLKQLLEKLYSTLPVA